MINEMIKIKSNYLKFLDPTDNSSPIPELINTNPIQENSSKQFKDSFQSHLENISLKDSNIQNLKPLNNNFPKIEGIKLKKLKIINNNPSNNSSTNNLKYNLELNSNSNLNSILNNVNNINTGSINNLNNINMGGISNFNNIVINENYPNKTDSNNVNPNSSIISKIKYKSKSKNENSN